MLATPACTPASTVNTLVYKNDPFFLMAAGGQGGAAGASAQPREKARVGDIKGGGAHEQGKRAGGSRGAAKAAARRGG